MSGYAVFQIIYDVIMLLGLGLVFARLARPTKDDPRLSRGLQILSNKISVTEDLSDRIDEQVKHVSLSIDRKLQEVNQKVENLQTLLREAEISRQKSLETSKLFEEKIPHREIVEREQSTKYVKAAQLAHAGKTSEEIKQELDLSQGEIDMIVNLNKQEMRFKDSELPWWLQQQAQAVAAAPTNAEDQIKAVGHELRRAMTQIETQNVEVNKEGMSL